MYIYIYIYILIYIYVHIYRERNSENTRERERDSKSEREGHLLRRPVAVCLKKGADALILGLRLAPGPRLRIPLFLERLPHHHGQVASPTTRLHVKLIHTCPTTTISIN